MTSELVLTSMPDNAVKVIEINRPQKKNALSQAVISALLNHLKDASDDPLIKAIVVTGSSTFFSAGADIKEISQLDAENAWARKYLKELSDAFRKVRKPLIAAVEGMALGGGFELALMCDVIFASKSAKFGLPEIGIGLIPGAGGTQRLTAALGKYRAMKIILLGYQLPAEEAMQCGLVSELFEAGTVLENTIKMASTLASRSLTAMALAKEAISRADDLCRDDEMERSLYYLSFGTHDKREGVEAFLDKRQPLWKS